MNIAKAERYLALKSQIKRDLEEAGRLMQEILDEGAKIGDQGELPDGRRVIVHNNFTTKSGTPCNGIYRPLYVEAVVIAEM